MLEHNVGSQKKGNDIIVNNVLFEMVRKRTQRKIIHVSYMHQQNRKLREPSKVSSIPKPKNDKTYTYRTEILVDNQSYK